MASRSVRISKDSYATLKMLAAKADESIARTLERAIHAYYAQQFFKELNASYAALKADPQAWAEELAERELWDATLADGLEDL
jgi:predicted transcriptional regulator